MTHLAVGDAISNAAERHGGKAEGVVGTATDDERLRADGRNDQVSPAPGLALLHRT